MKSKETKIQIDVKIGEEHISMAVPFSQQDLVRRIEAEINIFLKEKKDKNPNLWQKTYLAMAAYEFASKYFRLRDQYEIDSDEAENLLMEISDLISKEETEDEAGTSEEFDIY